MQRDDGATGAFSGIPALVRCDCAMMDTLWDYGWGKTEQWLPSKKKIGTETL